MDKALRKALDEAKQRYEKGLSPKAGVIMDVLPYIRDDTELHAIEVEVDCW